MRLCRRSTMAIIALLFLPMAAAFSAPPTLKPAALKPVMTVGDALPPVQRPATTSVAGATALVAGTTIGAGILALPAKTLEAGFVPSAITLVAAWAYMTVSALLIAEVNVNTLCSLERSSVSIKSMAGETIGDVGATAASLAYAFIHYALLIAYMLEGGKLLGELVPALDASATGIPAAVLFAGLGGGSLLAGNSGVVDKANSVLFIGVIISFLILVGFGSAQVQPALLAHALPAAALPAIPVMVLSFTFHNIVPTICYQVCALASPSVVPCRRHHLPPSFCLPSCHRHSACPSATVVLLAHLRLSSTPTCPPPPPPRAQLGCDFDKIRTAIIGGSAIPLYPRRGSNPYPSRLAAAVVCFEPLSKPLGGCCVCSEPSSKPPGSCCCVSRALIQAIWRLLCVFRAVIQAAWAAAYCVLSPLVCG